MSDIDASVVVPVYNQYTSLKCVLKGFSKQTYDKNKFEVIVIDDGSTDLLANESSESLSQMNELNIRIIHQNNKGRAVARNIGVEMANSELIIFCDGDRVPHNNFVDKHVTSENNLYRVTVGAAYDFFGKTDLFFNNYPNWNYVNKMSRIPPYYKKILLKNKTNDEVFQKYIWLSFLVGNSSINKKLFESVGGFDENINQWGFEHFELGYRLFQKHVDFLINTEAINYHIPHSRPSGFYEKHIISNIEYLCSKHMSINRLYLLDFFGLGTKI